MRSERHVTLRFAALPPPWQSGTFDVVLRATRGGQLRVGARAHDPALQLRGV